MRGRADSCRAVTSPQGPRTPRRNETSLSRVVNRPGTRDHFVAHLLLSFYIIVAPLRDHDVRTRVAPRAASSHPQGWQHGPFHAVISSVFGMSMPGFDEDDSGLFGTPALRSSRVCPSDYFHMSLQFFRTATNAMDDITMARVLEDPLRFEAKVF